jgi:hypothetical protein
MIIFLAQAATIINKKLIVFNVSKNKFLLLIVFVDDLHILFIKKNRVRKFGCGSENRTQLASL